MAQYWALMLTTQSCHASFREVINDLETEQFSSCFYYEVISTHNGSMAILL